MVNVEYLIEAPLLTGCLEPAMLVHALDIRGSQYLTGMHKRREK